MPWGQDPNPDGLRNSDALFGKKHERVGGEYGFPRGHGQKWVDRHRYSDSRVADMRENFPVPITQLEQRFPKEFEEAERRMKERSESYAEKFRHHVMYDYENDRTFAFWKAEQLERKKTLRIHDLDEWLDDFVMQVQYGLKVFTTLGLAHGGYKTYKLWSTIDRNYAKLHGVGLASIAMEQMSTSVLKGAGVGFAWGVGTLMGDNTARLADVMRSNTVHRPRRQWYNITAACVMGGLAASGAAVGVNWYTLKPMGHAMVTASLMSISTTLGVYLGVRIYKPWVEANPRNYEDSPRPWNEQEFQRNGPVGYRGRWA